MHSFVATFLVAGVALATTLGCTTPWPNSSKPADASSSLGTNAGAYNGHGAASVNAETLARFSPPKLDPAGARRIQAMLDIKAPGLGLLTPDGKRMFFGWSVSGTPQVWRVDAPKAFPQQMTGGTDVTGAVDLTPDGRYLVLSRDRNGEENPGIYLQSTEGGALKEVFHRAGIRASVRWITEDSRTLYYTANDIKPDAYALYAYDIGTGRRELVFDQPGLWSLADVRDDGLFLLAKMTGSRSAEYFTYAPQTKTLTPLLGQGEAEEYDVSFGARHGEYLVLTNKYGDFRRLYRLQNGKLSPLTPERPMDVAGYQIDLPRKRVLVQWNDQGFTRLEAFDAKSFAPLRLPAFVGAAHVYAGGTTRDGRYLTIGVESGRAPRTSYVYDWTSGRLTQWVLPSSPEIDSAGFSEATLEFYPARDGTRIPMLVRRPPASLCAASVCPVVVHFHGGPEGQSTPGFSPFAQMFVDAGFVWVEPNVRGSDGYGKAWLTADDGVKRLNVITDIEDAALHIRKAWAVNGQAPKIGVMGASYGGYATLYAMTRYSGAYDAGVANVGMSNLVTFLNNTAPYRRSLRMTEYGDPQKDRDALTELSPITHLAKIRGPLLIIQGVSDPRVPVGEALQMYQAMRGKGLEAGLILFADEGHGAIKRENRVLEIGHTIAFFQKHLGAKSK